MAYDYGNKKEPGIVTNVDSAETVTAGASAPADVGLVGQADLTTGTAEANTVYEVVTAGDARDWFGRDSHLTTAILDALNEGAYPVYACAPSGTNVASEDLSGSSYTGTLANAPVSEKASDTTFTINGTDLTTVKSVGDVHSETPGDGEVLLNPPTGEFHIDEALVLDGSDTVSYDHYDYQTAMETVEANAGELVDFLVPTVETDVVTLSAETIAEDMANEHNFAMALIGPASNISNKTSYTLGFDNSRVLAVYPSRNADGDTTLGSYAGLRARLGIQGTPINKRLTTQTKLHEKLSLNERSDLIENRVVPLAQESSGARVADDVNTVSDDNTEEANIRFGFNRLVVDYVLSVVRANERPFIGRLNSYAVRAALEGLIDNQLKSLKRSNAIVDYTVRVRKINATSAGLELNVETAEPLRFIENTTTIGNAQ